MAILKGAAKPDISTPEALKRTLVNARSIVYSKEGASGDYLARMIERLAIVEEMKPKTALETRPGHPPVAVVEGEAELGFSEILPVVEAEFAGPLPMELQDYVVFTAGIASTAKDVEAAKAFDHQTPKSPSAEHPDERAFFKSNLPICLPLPKT